jgi:hypothetical protein
MSQLALVTHDGVPVTINERPSEVEQHQEEDLTLTEIAMREAAKQSPKLKETK